MKKIFFVIISFLSLSTVVSQEARMMVSQIQAVPLNNDEVEISWQLPQLQDTVDTSQLSLLLYRSEEQQIGTVFLENLTPIATLPYETTSYIDSPVKNTIFYYTILIAGPETNNQALFVPASNTTVAGVELQPQTIQEITKEVMEDKPNASTGMRNTPLPYLKLPLQQTPGKDFSVDPERKQREIHAEKLGKKSTLTNLPIPHIFRQEQEVENVGEDFILQEIIVNEFVEENYELAEKSLRDFLNINHSKDAIDRATFYLGETLLYQGKYRQALSCFLAVQDRYPDLSIRWIQAALDGYQLPVAE